MGMVSRRFDVVLVNLDPTIGSEIQKTRPCLVISPDEMNVALRTVIVAPLTTGGKRYPSRIPCRIKGKASFVALDQLRSIDRVRILCKLGRINDATAHAALTSLQVMFQE